MWPTGTRRLLWVGTGCGGIPLASLAYPHRAKRCRGVLGIEDSGSHLPCEITVWECEEGESSPIQSSLAVELYTVNVSHSGVRELRDH